VAANVGIRGQKTEDGKQINHGNLNIQSLQDSATYTDKQSSSGFSISVPITGTGSAGGSINASKSSTKSNYQSVNQQAGIFAGNGGFQVNVAGNTDLKGAVIASTQQAANARDANGKPINQLNTQTLTTSNIENSADYKASSASFSAGVGSQKGASAGNAHLNDNSNSVTVSGISGGAVTIADNTAQQSTGKDAVTTVATLNRDVQTKLNNSTDAQGNTVTIATAVDSNGNNLASTLTPIFDKEQVQRELQAQVQITQAFSQVAPKAVGDYASNQVKDLIRQAQEADIAGDKTKAAQLLTEAEKWNDGGVYRVALHTALGGLSGNLEGALGAGASAAAIPKIAEQIKALDIPTELKDALILATASAIGGATGGTAGAGTALSETGNNFLSHELASERNSLRIKMLNGTASTEDKSRFVQLERADQLSDELLTKYRSGATLTEAEHYNLTVYLGMYQQQMGITATQALVKDGSRITYGWPYAGSNEVQTAYVKAYPEEFPWYRVSGGYSSGNAATFFSAWQTTDPYFANNNTSALPTSIMERKDYALIDAILNSPVLATGTYLTGTALGADKDKLKAATVFASNLSDIGASFIVPKTGLSPVFGEAVVGVKGVAPKTPNLLIDMNQQSKHYIGTNEYNTASASANMPRSTINLNIDVQSLVNQYAGTGRPPLGQKLPVGQANTRELVSTNKIIGSYYSTDAKTFIPTTNFTILYAKDNVHIVPAPPTGVQK
jgi:filamentous hemagglutinin